MRELRRLQAAFHAVATSAAPRDNARELVRDDGVDPRDRMQLYAPTRIARILGALVDEMPKLHHWLGEAAFGELVAAYLRTEPTRSPTLRDAGAALPAFLLERYGDDPGWPRWPASSAPAPRCSTRATPHRSVVRT